MLKNMVKFNSKYGKRVDFNGQKAHDKRFEAMLQVSF